MKLYKNDEYVKKIKELRSMECVWLETSYFFKDITITPKVGLRKFKGEKYMSKTKGISKKKDILKVFWNECAVFKVVVCILAYVILGFINIPINRWLTFHVPKWSDGKLHDITGSFFVLPILEVLAVTLIYLIANGCFYFISKMIAYRNYCYIPLTEDEIKGKKFKNANEYFSYVLNVLSYGFKNEKENLQVSDDDLREMLITCLIVFPDNGTIFQIKPETAWNVSDDILFSEAVELNCGKAEICLIVFPDNGTIFQIKPETAWNVSDDILFSEAVELNCGKAEIIDKHVVLSGDNRNGKREEYTV